MVEKKDSTLSNPYDYSLVIESVIKQYQTLEKLDPKNELLNVIGDIQNGHFLRNHEFFKRYPPYGKLGSGMERDRTALVSYYKDLEKAIQSK
jgi:hypothetical protein